MATWTEQYLAALRARDHVEKANLDLYNYCTKLADQRAELQKKAALDGQGEDAEPPTSPQPSIIGMGLRRVTSPALRPDSPTVVQMRLDLTKAQQERADLQARHDAASRELEAFKAKARSDSKRIAQLNSSLSQLTIKLRDRDEELRGKAKLIENVQDENVTLNLQLNMAEEHSEKLKIENRELVDRWMARMGKEADKMNEDNKFG